VKKLFLLLVVMLSLSGCMSAMVQPEGTLPAGFEIRTVAVKPEVIMEAQPFVQTPGEVWGGAIGGLLGAAIAAESSSVGQFSALMQQGNIDLKEIVSSSFKEQLRSNRTKIKLAKGAGDVSVQLTVLFYGIHPDGPFSSEVEPMLEVGGQVFDHKGRHVLNISESLKFPSDEEVTPRELEEYLSRPKLLAQAYKQLADIISKSMIEQLINRGQ